MKLFSRFLRGGGAMLTKSPFGVLLVLGLALTPPVVIAEEEVDTEQVAEEEAADAPAQAIEEIVVTGSRLRRDTFSSVSPLQIITSEVSREAGLIDAADILQGSTAASGQQIDLTFQGFVLDDGPGTSTVNLRGLAAARTLVLVNGRRIAPSGVEGAPTSPNLNIIPASLVQQYDILLDGASSIYGSDAVAGVVNAILRKDFDGWEVQTFSDIPAHGAGQNNTLALMWGRQLERGTLGFAYEYEEEEAVEFADRPWTDECAKNIEIDENGRIRTQDLYYSTNFGMRWDDCAVGLLAARMFVPGTQYGSIYYTPGYSNGGWPNFSESSSPFGVFGVDGDGDGVTDISFRDYSINGRETFAHLEPQQEQHSIFAYGDYTLEGEMNLTPYFEFLYVYRDFWANAGAGQLFPTVPALNPFNPCNPMAEGGVDCNLAYNQMLTNPGYVAGFSEWYTNLNGCFGLPPSICSPAAFGLFASPLGPSPVVPIVSVRGDRNDVYTETDIYRLVGGVTGDLPFLNIGSLSDWSFDLGFVFSRSDSSASRPGVRDDRLDLALGVFSSTNTPCENDLGVALEPDVAPGCVPINMFAPSLYPLGTIIGDFATQAERNYVFDSRDFDTVYEQSIVSFFMSGDLWKLPGGVVAGGIGVEWRKDEIRSIPDDVADKGLFFGFFSDGGAEGSKVTKELFAEIEFPFLAGVTLAEELSLNVAFRLTDDEYYGSAWTESFKLGYRPFSSLLLRFTQGSSYRAPNLRELFLQAQTGFLNLFDPCFIPELAWDQFANAYVPERDLREEYVLENCRREGVDPTVAWNNGFNVFSTEVSAGGELDLQDETSTSRTLGFAWEQPFTNEFDLAFGATYYQINVKNTIIEPPAQFIINDCYFTETGVSAFCERISRDFSNPVLPRFDIINLSFINRDSQRSKGVDINATFTDTVTLFERPFEVSMDFNAHRTLELSTHEVDDDGNLDFSRFEGEWYVPDWTFRYQGRVTYDRWRVVWTIDYLDGMKSDAAFIDPWDDISGIADTCLGPPNDVLCRDVEWTGDYVTHAISVFYNADAWGARVGVSNVFEEAPPRVNEGPTTSSNVPLGAGYDLHGRVFFLELRATFGGGF